MFFFNHLSSKCSLFCLAALISTTASATHTESINGELSGDYTAPDIIALSSGNNTITGTIGNNGNTGSTNGSDADYFSFNLNSNQTLTEINILSFVGSNNVSFFGYVEDSAFAGQEGSDVDGFELINAASGNVILDIIGGPITDTTLSFWLQETADTIVDYSIEFVVQEVPVPPAFLLFATSIFGLAFAKRKR